MGDNRVPVAYLGPVSSYSHEAALESFDQAEHRFEPQATFRDVFDAVQSSRATYGIIPFENSTNGSVVYTLDLFADRHGSYPDVMVGGETCLKVHHFLLGRRSQTTSGSSPAGSGASTPTTANPTTVSLALKPLVPLEHIKHVYSHPQALGQCELFLSTYLKHAERHEVSSTSKAAQLVAEGPGDSAAIASRVAATVRQLDVLAERIEDREDNTTRFFLLQRRHRPERIPQMNPSEDERKTLMSFTIDHQSPGALVEALMVFKKHRLNLTSITSRPSRERPWHYVFFVEFASHVQDSNLVDQAMNDLDRVAKTWRRLGSWPCPLED